MATARYHLRTWTVYGLFSLYQTWIFAPPSGAGTVRSTDGEGGDVDGVVLGVLLARDRPLSRRFPIDGRTWRWAVPLHLALLGCL